MNYKGHFFETDEDQYICPVSGAHFKFDQLCKLLKPILATQEK